MPRLCLRGSEWVVLAFFVYLALISPFFRDRPNLHLQPCALALVVFALLTLLSWAETTRYARAVSMTRDWMPLALTLVAFREMELFVPVHYNHTYERAWIQWDTLALNHYGLKHALEIFGSLVPTYLELCYLLVYGVGSFCIAVLWIRKKRPSVDRFYIVLLVGTLLSYALLPYFPSRPPRIVFPDVAPSASHDLFRRLNLFLLRSATIHSGVFPSAHVSSAFAASWAMFLVLPERKRFGWGLLVYALSVALATVYGRYHYAADALAGFCVSLAAAGVAIAIAQRQSANDRDAARSRANFVA